MIEVNHLNKTFHLKSGDVTALRDVSLHIEEGSVYGVIGYSGAGKSTLVRCLNLLARWRPIRRFCFPMKPPARWTRTRRSPFWRCSRSSIASWASPS